MTEHLDRKKLKLIADITSIDSEEELMEIEQYVKRLRLNKTYGEIFKGLKETLKVEDLVKAQDFSGIERAAFDQLIQELDIQESIEELLSMLD